jgi:hypothetical protein
MLIPGPTLLTNIWNLPVIKYLFCFLFFGPIYCSLLLGPKEVQKTKQRDIYFPLFHFLGAVLLFLYLWAAPKVNEKESER